MTVEHIGKGPMSATYILADALDHVQKNQVKTVFVVFIYEDERLWPSVSAAAFSFSDLARAVAKLQDKLMRLMRGEP
jgi:hypothetical protein